MGVLKPIVLGGLLLMTGWFPSSSSYEESTTVRVATYTNVSHLEQEIRISAKNENIPVTYLRGVVAWECGNNLASNVKNKNGTIDHGPGLNSRWLDEFAWRFNGGKKIDPHSLSSIRVVAKILANNHKVFHNWDWTLTSYRWGVQGTVMNGVDRYYVDNVKRLGNLGESIFYKE